MSATSQIDPRRGSLRYLEEAYELGLEAAYERQTAVGLLNTVTDAEGICEEDPVYLVAVGVLALTGPLDNPHDHLQAAIGRVRAAIAAA